MSSLDKTQIVKVYTYRLAKSLVPLELGDDFTQKIANDLYTALSLQQQQQQQEQEQEQEQGKQTSDKPDIYSIINNNKYKTFFLNADCKKEWIKFQDVVSSLGNFNSLDQVANYLMFLDTLQNETKELPQKDDTSFGPRQSTLLDSQDKLENKTMAQIINPLFVDFVSESDILTLLPYTLRGMNSKLFGFSANFKRIHIPDNIETNHRALLRPLFEYALLHKRLTLVVEINRGTFRLAIHSSFIALLEKINQEYIKDLNAIFQTKPSTILTVYLKIYNWIYILRFLFRTSLKLKVLNGLDFIKYIHNFTKYGDDNIRNIAKRTFEAVVTPYYKILEFWIIKGELTDDNNEFFISFDATKNHFNDIIVFHNDKVPEFIYAGDKIFQIGKTLIFLNKYCRELEWVNQYISEYSSRLFSNHDGGLVSMTINQRTSLIDDAYEEVLSYFNKLMHQKYGLIKHLDNFKRFYLLGENDFIEAVMVKGVTIFDKPAVDITPSQLDRVLNEAIQTSAVKNQRFADRLDMKIFTSEEGNFGWEAFLISYKIDDLPFSYLFEDQITQYFKMFHLLRRIRHLELLLDANFVRFAELNIANKRSLQRLLSSQTRRIIKLNYMRKVLIDYLCTISSYLSYDVIEASFKNIIVADIFAKINDDTELLLDRLFMKLEKKHGAKYNVNTLTIDDLINSHAKYLKNIVYTDILNEQVVGKKSQVSYIDQIQNSFQIIFEFVNAEQEYYELLQSYLYFASQEPRDGQYKVGVETDLERINRRIEKLWHKVRFDIFETEFVQQRNILKADLKVDNNLLELGSCL